MIALHPYKSRRINPCYDGVNNERRTLWTNFIQHGFTAYVEIRKIEIFETGKVGILHSFREIEQLMQRKKQNAVKQLLRSDAWPVDEPVRTQLWPALCAAKQQDQLIQNTSNGVYWQLVELVFGTRALPMKTQRLPQFIDLAYCLEYNLNARGCAVISRVASVLAFEYPGITYSPIIYPILALLLHYVSEEETYHCMTLLLDSTSYVFLNQTKLMHEKTWQTLLLLARRHAENALLYFKNIFPRVEIERWFMNWYWWIFAGLPFEHLVRIMDCYLNEGLKVLYRVALVILNLFCRKWHSNGNLSIRIIATDVDNAMKLFCAKLPLSPAKLLKAAFGIRGLSTRVICKSFKQTDTFVAPYISAPVQDLKISHKSLRSSSNNCCVRPWHNLLYELWSWLPQRVAIRRPFMLFSLQQDGRSLQTFYEKMNRNEPTLVMIRTVKNEIFGAYCSTSWYERQDHSYFGTGETFIFALYPKRVVYPWVGKNLTACNDCSSEWFIAADKQRITIGGGDGEGIWLDKDLRHGRTTKCRTFDNEPLCESGEFEIHVLEVYGFQAI